MENVNPISSGAGTVVPTLIVSPKSDQPTDPGEPISTHDEELKQRLLKELYTPLTEEEIRTCDVTARDIPGGFRGAMVLCPRGAAVDPKPAHRPSTTVMMKGYDTHNDNMKMERTDGTDRKIKFLEGSLLPLHSGSMRVMRYLLNHKKWGITWDIDKNDDGGLWTFLGWVKTEAIEIKKVAINTKTVMAKKAG